MSPAQNESGLKARMTAKGWLVMVRFGASDWRPKRIPVDIKSERAALAYAAAWRDGILKKQDEAAAAVEIPTVKDAEAKWRTFTENNDELAPATRRQRAEIMSNWILPDLGSKRMTPEGITPSDLRKLLKDAKAHVSTSRLRNIASTLSVFFNDAIGERWGQLETNPMLHPHVQREIPAARRARKVIIRFTIAQFERLVASASTPAGSAIWYALGGLTGCDAGEIAGATWGDLDLDHTPPTLSIERAFRLDWKIGKTKRETRVRKIPVHPALVSVLTTWKEGEATKRLGHKPKSSDPIIPSPEGKFWRPKLSQQIRADLERAQLPTEFAPDKPFDFKSLRRSFASWLEAADVPKERRDRLMGHAPAHVGEAHYTETELSKLHEMISRVRVDFSLGKLLQLPLKGVG